jgi:hypothetical protein
MDPRQESLLARATAGSGHKSLTPSWDDPSRIRTFRWNDQPSRRALFNIMRIIEFSFVVLIKR